MYFHEIAKMALSRYTIQKSPNETLLVTPIIHNPFSTAAEDSDVIAKVGTHTLHLHSWLLSFYSPVFKSMLNGYFKEGITKEIELKEKEPEHVIEMFKYFYPSYFPRITGNTRFDNLLELCREYQLDWLRKQFDNYLVEGYKEKSDEDKIKLLYLSEEYKMHRSKEAILQHEFVAFFSTLSTFDKFNRLSALTQSQLAVKGLLYSFLNTTGEKKSYKFSGTLTYGGRDYEHQNLEKCKEFNAVTRFLKETVPQN